jgi:signal transduction histidine kinase/CheY-like chemotaxis protein
MWKLFSSKHNYLLVLFLGFAVSVGLFFAVQRADKAANESRFYELAIPRLAAVKADIATAIDTVVMLGGHFSVHPPVATSRAEFTRLATSSWQRHPYVQALAGVTHVTGQGRVPLEQMVEKRDEHPGFRLTQRSPEGVMVPDAERDEYFPVLYEVPKAGNEPAFGYNLGSEPMRLEALITARDTGELVSTHRIKLVQGAGDQYGVLLFNPVYAVGPRDSMEERRAGLLGFAMGVFRIGDLIKLSGQALGEETQQGGGKDSADPKNPPIEVHVYDMSVPDDQSQLFPKTPEVAQGTLLEKLHATASVPMGGREWKVVVTPTAAFSNPVVTLNAVVVFLAAIMTTLAFSLFVKRGHERAVNEALFKTNQKLEQQQVELAEANLAANAASKAKSDFLSSMSHELRTPLHAIIGFSELLLDGTKPPPTERQRKQLLRINKGGEYLLYLINEILEFTKIEVGKLSLKIEDIVSRDLFESCLSLAEPLMVKYGVTLQDDTPEPGPILKADRVRLQQVILNLLTNAAKYNKAGGSIRLGCQLLGQTMARITVTDTGIGIASDKQSQLFIPFNRLGAEGTEIEGSGIGLALSRNLAEMMGGSLDYESEAGVGSTFWVDVPLSSEQSPPLENSVLTGGDQFEALAEVPGHPRSILYIEDNPDNVSLMQDFIEIFAGWTLVTAPNAELGITLAESKDFDLIICDINLPGMNGIEAVKLLRAGKCATTPILALSADATYTTMEEGKTAGFSDYLTKPIRLKDLEQIINISLK